MKFKNILTGITISFFSILLLFSVAEIAVRILYPGIIPNTKFDWSSRNKGYPLEKPRNAFRIVVLGDSYTFGQGVTRDETFSKKLEGLLNSYGGKIKFEVVNLGFCGLNTLGELEILAERGINPETWLPDKRYRGLAYNPDLIILEYTLNDASTSGRSMEQVKQFDDKWRTGAIMMRVNSGPYSLPIPEPIDKFLTKKSRAYLFFMDRYNKLKAMLGLVEGSPDSTPGRYKEGSMEWDGSKWALNEIVSLSRQNSIPALLAVWPWLIKLDDYPFKEVHNKIITVGNRMGFYTLDLFHAFKGMDGQSLSVPLDGHPNARAHEIAAKAIFRYLVNERLVPSF